MTTVTKRLWEAWFWLNLDMLFRHVGTAGAVWLATSLKNNTLFIEGHLNAHDLWISLEAGVILPFVFTLFQRGIPRQEEQAQIQNTIKDDDETKT